jgi:hypothetical protein
MGRHFGGGVSRKYNRDEIVAVLIREKVWLEKSLSQLERGGVCPSTETVSSQLFFLLIVPMKMEQTDCFETSAYKIQTLGNHPKERT